MTVPAFTATASLYKTKAQYHTTSITSLRGAAGKIMLQQMPQQTSVPLARPAQRQPVIGDCSEGSCCFLTAFCICCCEYLVTGPACSCICNVPA